MEAALVPPQRLRRQTVSLGRRWMAAVEGPVLEVRQVLVRRWSGVGKRRLPSGWTIERALRRRLLLLLLRPL